MAKTVYTRSLTQSVVQAIVNGTAYGYTDATSGAQYNSGNGGYVTNGDTVILPAAGSPVSWTTGLTISKAIKFLGQNVDPLGVDDQTVILDDIPRPAGPYASLITYNLSSDLLTEFGGITLRAGTVALGTKQGAGLSVAGRCHNFRIHHAHFDHLTRYAYIIAPQSDIWGVADHYTKHSSNVVTEDVSVNHGNYGGSTYGHGSWAEGPHFGDGVGFFNEDYEWINDSGVTTNRGCGDSQWGGLQHYRHGYHKNNGIGNHETKDNRGGRTTSIFRCAFETDIVNAAFTQLRSGTELAVDNALTGTWAKGQLMAVYQMAHGTKIFDSATGICGFDVMATESDGTHVDGHAPYVFYTGTAGSGTAGHVINLPATVPNLVSYTARNTRTGKACIITVSTATQIKTDPDGFDAWLPGDGIEVYKILKTIDQTGRGQCDLISGITPTTTKIVGGPRNGLQVYPNQQSEPIYSVKNTLNGSPWLTFLYAKYAILSENTDFFNQKAGFAPSTTPSSNLTTGTGYGTLANRPTTAAEGVAYWATDDGPANQNGAVSGQLYVRRSGAWVLYWTPFQYPHPLAAGAAGKLISLEVLPPFTDLNYGNVLTSDTPPARTIRLRSFGDETVTLSSVSGFTSEFTGSASGFSVASGASHDLVLTYAPSGAGADSGTLTFNGDQTGGTNTIAFSGTGVAPAIDVPPPHPRRIRRRRQP